MAKVVVKVSQIKILVSIHVRRIFRHFIEKRDIFRSKGVFEKTSIRVVPVYRQDKRGALNTWKNGRYVGKEETGSRLRMHGIVSKAEVIIFGLV